MKTRKKYFKRGSKRKYLKKGLKRKTVRRRSRRKTVKKGRRKYKAKYLKKNGGGFLKLFSGLFSSSKTEPTSEPKVITKDIEDSSVMVDIDMEDEDREPTPEEIEAAEELLVSNNGKTCRYCNENFEQTKNDEQYKEYQENDNALDTKTRIKLHGKYIKNLCKTFQNFDPDNFNPEEKNNKTVDAVKKYDELVKLMEDHYNTKFPYLIKKKEGPTI